MLFFILSKIDGFSGIPVKPSISLKECGVELSEVVKYVLLVLTLPPTFLFFVKVGEVLAELFFGRRD